MKHATLNVLEILESRKLLSAGTIDNTFGAAGKWTTAGQLVGGSSFAMAVEPDGKIVLAGGGLPLGLKRFNADGTLDRNFAVPTSGLPAFRADAVFASPDGTLYAAGTINGDMTVVHLLAAGAPDPHFGNSGFATITPTEGTPDGGMDALGLTVDNSGRAYVVGDVSGTLAVSRFTPSGIPDSQFGNSGLIETPTGSIAVARAVALDNNGEIVVLGTQFDLNNSEDKFIILRYGVDGSLDASFNSTGIRTLGFIAGSTKDGTAASQDDAYALVIQADGEIVVAGDTIADGDVTHHAAVARLNPDGSVDNTFGQKGRFVSAFPGSAFSVALGPDGSIYTGGDALNDPTGYDFESIKLTPAGALDTVFGGTGVVLTDMAGRDDRAWGLSVRGDGTIIFGGDAQTGSMSFEDTALLALNADGSLDNAFGVGGKVVTSTAGKFGQFSAVQVDADGFIVAAGSTPSLRGDSDFFVARFSASGEPDPAFDGNGQAITDVSSGTVDAATSLLITTDGSILVGGVSAGYMTIVKYRDDGTLDTTFATGGKAVEQLPGAVLSMSVDANGLILAAGENFAVIRLKPDGSLDTGFGTDGKTSASFFGLGATASSIAIKPDGAIVVGGSALVAGQTYDFAAAQFNDDGSLDTLFGQNGMATISFGTDTASAAAIKLQPDGKIILAGARGSIPEFAFARLSSNGSLDRSFGSNGTTLVDPSAGSGSAAVSLVVASDGSMTGAGYSTSSTGSADFALVHLLPNGNLDHTFGVNGITTTDFQGDSDIASAIALDTQGRLIVAGSAVSPAQLESAPALARYSGSLIVAMGNGVVSVNGTTGNDSIALSRGSDNVSVLLSLNGSDSLYNLSTVRGWLINGLEGNDTVALGAGISGASVNGGAGADSLSAVNGGDTLSGSRGPDTILGGNGAVHLFGGRGRDLIIAQGGNALLIGGLGADTLESGAGIVSLLGGPGPDLIYAASHNDSISTDASDTVTSVTPPAV